MSGEIERKRNIF